MRRKNWLAARGAGQGSSYQSPVISYRIGGIFNHRWTQMDADKTGRDFTTNEDTKELKR